MPWKKYSKVIWIGRFGKYNGFAASTREYFTSIIPYFGNGHLQLAPLEVLEKTDPLRNYLSDLSLEDSEFKIVNHIPTTDPEAEGYFSVCEYDRIPQNWANIFNQARFIMTQSNFCKEVFSKQIKDPTKIYTIPYIIPSQFKPDGPRLRLYPEDKFIFGSVFQWVPRKVPERTIQAFMEEFSPDEPVELVLRTKIPYILKNNDIIKKIAQDKRIRIIEEPIDDLAAFYRGLNAYISCTAGEGCGQTLAEAMVCGVPTIGSRHSGNLEFMNDGNSYLVDVNDWSNVPKTDAFWRIIDGLTEFRWKLPKIESIREKMRELFELWKTERTLPNENHEIFDPKVKNAIKLRKIMSRENFGPVIYRIIEKYIEN